ncbi:hypothetical protein EV714DRAFT_201280 [Schizophyllum commune]
METFAPDSFTPEHKDLLERLDALAAIPLEPLPRNIQSAFNRQVRARFALLKERAIRKVNIGGGGRPKRTSKNAQAAAAAPPTATPPAATPAEQAETRVALIRARETASPRTMTQTWDVILSLDPSLSRADAEDEALARLLSGIDYYDAAEWSASSPYTDVHRALLVHANAGVAGEGDAAALVRLHNRIVTSETQHSVDTFVGRVLVQLDAIEFGLRWQAIGHTRGGRSVEKEEFYRNAYASQFAEDQIDKAGLSTDPDFQDWKRKTIAPIVCGRNRLVNAYRTFGLLVLTDPFWDTRALDNSHRTPAFPFMLKALIEDANHIRAVDDKVVRQLLYGVCDVDLCARVRQVRQLERELFEEDSDEDESEEE